MTKRKKPVLVEQQTNPIPVADDFTADLVHDPLHGIDSGPCKDFAPDTLGDVPKICTSCFYNEVDHVKTVEIAPIAVEIVEPEPVKIKLNEVLSLAKPGGIESIPTSNNPFYILAKDGLFMQVMSLLGRAITPTTKLPPHLPAVGHKGWFEFTAERIPAALCAQIVDFFQRIYDKQKTEAEVILLMNRKTREWGVLIPTQKVSGVAVDSRVDPTLVPKDNLIVGTMHSHANMSAFHSGTDKSDAEDMNGVHFTIGKLGQETPEIVSMVMWNGIYFDFSPEELADFSDLDAAEAPAEWDDYVTAQMSLQSNHKPKGYDLFDKYPKPVKAIQPWAPPTSPWVPQTNLGYGPNYKAKNEYLKYSWQDNFDDFDLKRWGIPTKQNEDKAYYNWLKNNANDSKDDPLWHGMSNLLIDAIFNSSCLTDEDIDEAQEVKPEADSTLYWRNLFIRKMANIVMTLRAFNTDVSYSIEFKEVKNKGVAE